MTDYEYDEYQEVMKQALLTMNELLDAFEPQESEVRNDKHKRNDHKTV
jgi:hypothetical protein